MSTQKLYFYECFEAAKYYRSGYTWNWTLKMVKADIRANYHSPTRIKIRLIGEETEEYCEQIKLKKKLCPKCHENYLDQNSSRNALSRRDNKTEICEKCGMTEAFEDMLGYNK